MTNGVGLYEVQGTVSVTQGDHRPIVFHGDNKDENATQYSCSFAGYQKMGSLYIPHQLTAITLTAFLRTPLPAVCSRRWRGLSQGAHIAFVSIIAGCLAQSIAVFQQGNTPSFFFKKSFSTFKRPICSNSSAIFIC